MIAANQPFSGASSISVSVCYRPLRIGWAIKAGDWSAFRRVVELNYTLRGGRYNPILVADDQVAAHQLIDLFGVDLILPVGSEPVVTEFPAQFPHLADTLRSSLFMGDPKSKNPIDAVSPRVLDMINTYDYWAERVQLASLEKAALEPEWDPADPLGNVFRVQLGVYPPPDEIGIDYADAFRRALKPKAIALSPSGRIPPEVLGSHTPASITWYEVDRHYGRSFRAELGGYFVGDATDLEDLVTHWNLRAADIELWFQSLETSQPTTTFTSPKVNWRRS